MLSDVINKLIIEKLRYDSIYSASSPYCLTRLCNLISYCHDDKKGEQKTIDEKQFKTFESIIVANPLLVSPSFDYKQANVISWDNNGDHTNRLKLIGSKIFNSEIINETPLANVCRYLEEIRRKENQVMLFSCLAINYHWKKDMGWDPDNIRFTSIKGKTTEIRKAMSMSTNNIGIGVWNEFFAIVRFQLPTPLSLDLFKSNNIRVWQQHVLNLNDNLNLTNRTKYKNNPTDSYVTLIIPCNDISEIVEILKSEKKDEREISRESRKIGLGELHKELVSDQSLIRKLITADIKTGGKFKIIMPDIKTITNLNFSREDFEKVDYGYIFQSGYFKHLTKNQSVALSKIDITTHTNIDDTGIFVRAAAAGYASDSFPSLDGVICINRPFMFSVSQGEYIFSLGYING